MQPPLLFPQGPLPLSWAPFQVHGHVAGEAGAELTRLMPHKTLSATMQKHRGEFSEAPPHAVKLMGLITACLLSLYLKHEKHFYSMHSKRIL